MAMRQDDEGRRGTQSPALSLHLPEPNRPATTRFFHLGIPEAGATRARDRYDFGDGDLAYGRFAADGKAMQSGLEHDYTERMLQMLRRG